MSTRSTTHFIDGNEKKPTAIIYRHSDGYPEGAGVDIYRFFDECAKLRDSRLTDSSYLAAKYVVFLADMFNRDWSNYNETTGEYVKKESKFDFISVGVVSRDPFDIEYRYVIDCSRLVDGKPVVKCYHVDFDWKTGKETQKELVEIPAPEKTA